MNPEQAAEALAMLRPRITVPIHWGTIHPLGFGRFSPRWLSEPPKEFARLAARTVPAVDVRVVEPGDSVELG